MMEIERREGGREPIEEYDVGFPVLEEGIDFRGGPAKNRVALVHVAIHQDGEGGGVAAAVFRDEIFVRKIEDGGIRTNDIFFIGEGIIVQAETKNAAIGMLLFRLCFTPEEGFSCSFHSVLFLNESHR